EHKSAVLRGHVHLGDDRLASLYAQRLRSRAVVVEVTLVNGLATVATELNVGNQRTVARIFGESPYLDLFVGLGTRFQGGDLEFYGYRSRGSRCTTHAVASVIGVVIDRRAAR